VCQQDYRSGKGMAKNTKNKYDSLVTKKVVMKESSSRVKTFIMDLKKNEYNYYITFTEVAKGKYLRVYVPNVCFDDLYKVVSKLTFPRSVKDDENVIYNTKTVYNLNKSKEFIIRNGKNDKGLYITIAEHYKEGHYSTIYIPRDGLVSFNTAFKELIEEYEKLTK